MEIELQTYLRKSLNSKEQKIINNLRFRDSQKDVLIHLADMVAGSINRFTQKDKTDHKVYRNIIRKREDDVWFFGKNKKRSTS